MPITLNGTTGITNDGGYTGDGVSFADTTPANTLVTTTGGDVCVGTTSPIRSSKFSVTGDIGNSGNLNWGTTGNGRIYSDSNWGCIFTADRASPAVADFMWQNGGGTERMRIDSSGNLLVGKTANNQTSPGIMFGRQENGNAPLSDWVKTFSGTIGSIRNWHNGTYVGGVDFSNTATSFPTSSDVRLKKDITEAPSASAKIDQIRVVSHGWVHDDSVVEFGVIAQELYEVAEQAVTQGDDGIEVQRTWTVDYSKLVPMLIKAHQEQQAAIQEIKTTVDLLSTELDSVKAELTALKGAA